MKYKFKIGDVFESHGANIKIVERFVHEGKPAYGLISKWTVGDPWLFSETVLSELKLKIRKHPSAKGAAK